MKKIVFQILFLMLVSMIYGQENDAQLWIENEFEKKITPDFSLNFSHQIRIDENITQLRTYLAEFGFTYKISKSFKISPNYRYYSTRNSNNLFFSSRHKFYLDLIYQRKINPFNFTSRLRLQSKFADIFSDDQGNMPENALRFKMTLKYRDIKKLTPYLNSELFFDAQKKFICNNYRISAGLNFKINRMHSLDFFYLFEHDTSGSIPKMNFISGIGYSFVF